MFSWLSLLFPQARLILAGIAIAAVLAVAGGLYAKGRIDAAHAQETALLKGQLAFEREQARKARAAAIADQMAAEAAAADVSDLEAKIQELTNATANPGNACLDDADVGRLRQLQARPGR